MPIARTLTSVLLASSSDRGNKVIPLGGAFMLQVTWNLRHGGCLVELIWDEPCAEWAWECAFWLRGILASRRFRRNTGLCDEPPFSIHTSFRLERERLQEYFLDLQADADLAGDYLELQKLANEEDDELNDLWRWYEAACRDEEIFLEKN